ARKSDPTCLLRLAPESGNDVRADLDGELVAALLRGDTPGTDIVAAWRTAVDERLTRGNDLASEALLTLPWCGALLAAGDLDGALRTLARRPRYQVGIERIDAHLFGAAMPPLARWARPADAAAVADAIVDAVRREDEARRGVFARLGAVLAARLAEGGDEAAARALRERLREAGVGLSRHALAWLGEWAVDRGHARAGAARTSRRVRPGRGASLGDGARARGDDRAAMTMLLLAA